ncbi:MAG: hypothetical protein R6V15_17690, partial [Desulfotignum sp.]
MGGIKYTNCEHGLSVKAGRQKKAEDDHDHHHPPPEKDYEDIKGKGRDKHSGSVPSDWLTLLNRKI